MRRKMRMLDPGIAMWIALAVVCLAMFGRLVSPKREAVVIITIVVYGIYLIIYWIRSYTQKINKRYFDIQLQLQKENADKEYYQLLAKQTEEQHIMVHDMKKHLHTVLGLLEKEEVSEAKKYIQNITMDAVFQKEIAYSDNAPLNMLLSYYTSVCRKEGISLEIDVRKKSVEYLSFEDLTALFGNLLENAIEACQGAEDAFIELTIQKLDGENTLITLINSCRTEPKMAEDDSFMSTKKDHENHGLGIKSVSRIAKKYDGELKVYYSGEDRTFHSIVCIKNKLKRIC